MKRDATSASLDQRILSISGTPLGNVTFDLADGIYSQMNYFGTEMQYQLTDAIKVENRNRYSDGFRSIDYAFNGVPTAWQSIANAAAGRDATQFAAGLSGGSYGFRLTYPGQNNAVAAPNASAAAALGNGYGNRKSWQHSEGDVNDFQNDLRLIGTFNSDKTIASAGLYYSFLTTEQHYLFNTILTDVSPEPKRVDIMIVNATTGADIGPVTSNGLYHFADQYRNADAEEREVSPYVSVEHKIGAFTMDAGLRHNIVRQTATRELVANTTHISATNPALRGGQFGTGQIVTRENRTEEDAYSAGLNYIFNKRLATFGRYSRGVRFLGITELTDDMHANRATSPSRIITTYEVGVKWGTPRLAVVMTAFQAELKGIQDTQVTIDPVTGLLGPTVIAIAQQESKGIELETVWTPLSGLSLGINGTVQDVQWTDHNLKTQTLSNGTVVAFDENGRTPERTPKVVGKFMASYRFAQTTFGTFSVNGSYQYTGERPTDRFNSKPTPLQAYGETQVGVAFASENGFIVRVSVNNLFDDEGLSEGDPRTGSNVLDPTVSVYNARPIQPRTITGTVSYRF
jgi:outer membrane receptor protein involved in Fe transport